MTQPQRRLDSTFAMKEQLRAITSEGWSQTGSTWRCGPLTNGRNVAVSQSLRLFGVQPEFLGTSLSLTTPEVAALMTFSRDDIRDMQASHLGR